MEKNQTNKNTSFSADATTAKQQHTTKPNFPGPWYLG